MINQVDGNNSVRAFRDFSQPKNGYIIVPEQKKEDEQAPTQISDKIRSKIKGKAIFNVSNGKVKIASDL